MAEIRRDLDRHLARAESRAVRREVWRMEARAQTVLARIEIGAHLQVAGARGVADVGTSAVPWELEAQVGRIVAGTRNPRDVHQIAARSPAKEKVS